MPWFALAALFLAAFPAFGQNPKRGLQLAVSHPEVAELGRILASEPGPSISYLTYRGSRPVVEEISLERWKKRFSEGGRFDYLLKFYYANTKESSNSGLRHAACFEGNPAALASQFFAESVKIRSLSGDVIASPSTDGFLLGIQFQFRQPNGRLVDAHFRLPHCTSSGKNEVLGEEGNRGRVPQSRAGASRVLASDLQEGYRINDVVEGSPELPRFELKADFENAKDGKDERPWKGMDIRKEEGAFRFAELVQAHFYEGMANQSPDPNRNFVAAKASRYWCHMPWLNQGRTQREAIHGLTMEMDLAPNPVYPDAPRGSNWGVAYFNSVACRTLGKVFGTRESGFQDPPLWTQSRFEDGAMSVKVLYTTADFPALDGAFAIQANVSLPKETGRLVRPVKHLQLDIAVRDSSIKGTKASNFHWVMTTYYYDANYQAPESSPLRRIQGLPEAFLRMRPVGVQVGFDTEDSLLFAGAKTNQEDGRLNGPADNPKSSCLGCHATAGTRIRMAPGVISNLQFERDVAPQPTHLDFNQQVALAKRNYETRFRPRP